MSLDNLTEHEKAFYDDGFRLGKEAAQHASNEKVFLSYIGEMYTAIDQLIDSILGMAKRQNIPVDCRKGCEYCCHQAVFANSYELHYLGNFINDKFYTPDKDAVIKKAVEKNKLTKKMSDEQVLSYKSPCPLLKDGACSAYQARPMACRIYLSMRLSSCIEFFKNPDNPNSFPQLLEFPLMAGRMMNEGFTAALREKDIEIAEFRMEDGLATMLKYGANR